MEQANRVLSWQDGNLTEDEIPPEWMWHLDHELGPWFEGVKRDRDEKYGGDRNNDTVAPMMENEFAQRMRNR